MTISVSDPKVYAAQVAELIHIAFVERTEIGCITRTATISEQEFLRELEGGVLLTAWEDETLVGSIVFHVKTNRRGCKYSYIEYWAVHPDYRRRGVGSALLERAFELSREYGCQYAVSDTSVKWASSIAGHKRAGFEIVGYASYKSTNYYSYIFRKNLTGKGRSPLRNKASFIWSFIKTRALRTASGTPTWWGKLIGKQ